MLVKNAGAMEALQREFLRGVCGGALLLVVCILGVAFYVGFNEVMGWCPGKWFFAAMDKASEFGGRLARKLKRRGSGDAA